MKTIRKKRHRYPTYMKIRKACEQGYRCARCGDVLPAAWEGDHIIPLADGGGTHYGNLQVLDPTCHALKTAEEATMRATSFK